MKAATVVTTREFETQIKGLLDEDDLRMLEFAVATSPAAHPIIPGTDGVRQMRFARSGMGKRGGIRVVYFYAISAEVVILLSAHAKNQKENLSSADKKNLRKAVEFFQKALTR